MLMTKHRRGVDDDIQMLPKFLHFTVAKSQAGFKQRQGKEESLLQPNHGSLENMGAGWEKMLYQIEVHVI